jgi:hypothetical protein
MPPDPPKRGKRRHIGHPNVTDAAHEALHCQLILDGSDQKLGQAKPSEPDVRE